MFNDHTNLEHDLGIISAVADDINTYYFFLLVNTLAGGDEGKNLMKLGTTHIEYLLKQERENVKTELKVHLNISNIFDDAKRRLVLAFLHKYSHST